MYGKIINNELQKAPNCIEFEGKIILNPQEKQYISAGYKPVEYGVIPEIAQDEELTTSFVEEKGKIIVLYGVAKKELSFNEVFALKIAENEQKRAVEFISTPLGQLKTQTPLGDLKTALPLFDKIAEANNGLPQGTVRVYIEGKVTASPALTLNEYRAISTAIALEYLKIDALSTQITQKILEAKTIDELNAIDVNYEMLPELTELAV